MLGAEEFAAWYRLAETPGVSRGTARRLLAACGSAEAVFRCAEASLQSLVGLAAAQALLHPPDELHRRLAAASDWLSGGADREVLTLADAGYPPALLQGADPPLMLYAQGDPAWLLRPSIAVVGSRNPTPQGEENAKAFAAALGTQGFVIVSGLALGVDAAAHEGALSAGQGTVAVVGTGLDRVYPARHRSLSHRIAAQGVLISEYPPGTPPRPSHFPQRNRIIAGLTLGTLVVEAALESGSLITARLASEAGREVFAIPGSIHSPQSRGCHQLLKQGAKLVETAEDVVEELRAGSTVQRSLPLGEPTPGDPLLEALGHDPVTLDALISRTGWPAAELSAQLMSLELDGRVARLPGGLYQSLHRG